MEYVHISTPSEYISTVSTCTYSTVVYTEYFYIPHLILLCCVKAVMSSCRSLTAQVSFQFHCEVFTPAQVRPPRLLLLMMMMFRYSQNSNTDKVL